MHLAYLAFTAFTCIWPDASSTRLSFQVTCFRAMALNRSPPAAWTARSWHRSTVQICQTQTSWHEKHACVLHMPVRQQLGRHWTADGRVHPPSMNSVMSSILSSSTHAPCKAHPSRVDGGKCRPQSRALTAHSQNRILQPICDPFACRG
jgi:hypothetical protein